MSAALLFVGLLAVCNALWIVPLAVDYRGRPVSEVLSSMPKADFLVGEVVVAATAGILTVLAVVA